MQESVPYSACKPSNDGAVSPFGSNLLYHVMVSCFQVQCCNVSFVSEHVESCLIVKGDRKQRDTNLIVRQGTGDKATRDGDIGQQTRNAIQAVWKLGESECPRRGETDK